MLNQKSSAQWFHSLSKYWKSIFIMLFIFLNCVSFLIEDPPVIQRILQHRGLPFNLPAGRPARGQVRGTKDCVTPVAATSIWPGRWGYGSMTACASGG